MAAPVGEEMTIILPGIGRQRFFTIDGKITFIGKLSLQLFKFLEQLADAVEFNGVDDDLIFAARFIYGNSSEYDYLLAVLQLQLDKSFLLLEKYRPDLGTGVL